MAYGSVNVDKITTSDGISSAGVYGFKNRLINGNFAIDQRNAGASVSCTTSTYSCDRWLAYASQSSKMTAQQNAGSVTPAVGFNNYLGTTVGASANVTVGATDLFGLIQRIEGFNFADLGWGTASAKTVTLSFQVYSSLTGTYGGTLQNSSSTRSYPFTYTISSANTWTTISVTIAGDTTGTWVGATNGVGVQLTFGLGVGSTYSGTAGAWAGATYFSATGATNWISTNSATFYITGTQLEVGSTATSFDYRPYGTELQLCRRYFQQYGLNNDGSGLAPWGPAWSTNGTSLLGMFTFDQQMRTSPTITYSSSADFQWIDFSAASNAAYNLSAISSGRISAGSARIEATASSGTPTTGRGGVFTFNSAGRVFCSSEL